MSVTTTTYPGTIVLMNTGIAAGPTTFNVNKVEGWYVALQIPGTGKIISLAEMQVYGIISDTAEESTLLINFGAFTVTAEPHGISLEWSTFMENNSNSFDIEKLNNHKQFVRIGSISANGYPSSYKYKDLSPINGTNTYPLKEYDKDGSFTYSAIKSATFGNVQSSEVFVIQPNPVLNILKVLKPASVNGKLIFKIVNTAGRKILEWNVNDASSVI